MKQFKVSIIIPFYNGEVFYASLLQSIKRSVSLCDSESVSFEIITIVDSMDTNVHTINDIAISNLGDIKNIEVIIKKNDKNIGVAGSRNVALALAKGNHFHMIDQDDEVDSAFYPSIAPLLDCYDFILTNGLVKYENKKHNSHLLYYLPPKLSLKHLLTNEFIRSPGQIVFSENILSNIKFPEPKKFKGADDRFFWIKLFLDNLKIKTMYLHAPLYIANIHDSNYSSDQVNLRKSSLENWNALMLERDLSKYKKIIANNVLSLQYSAGEHMKVKDRIMGSFIRLVNFLEPNKIIRFFFKRIKW